MTDHSVSCPQTRRVFSRRKMQDKWRRSPRWMKLLVDHAHVPDAVCVHCRMKHGQQRYDGHGNPLINNKGQSVLVVLTINHKTRDLYHNEDLYLTWNPDKMEVCCTICNRMYEKGMKPCPKCLKPGHATYIKWYDTECNSCYFREHPEELQKSLEGTERFKEAVRNFNAGQAAKRRAKKKTHPCKSYRVGGICGKSIIGRRCPHAPTKAKKNCMGFEERRER